MSWANFDKDTNENIEKAFCNPSKTNSDSGNHPFQISFKQIPSVSKTHFTNDSFSMLYRRLSTRSSVIDNKNAKQGVTHWKWYWEKSVNVWEEYKTWVGLFFYILSSSFFSLEISEWNVIDYKFCTV